MLSIAVIGGGPISERFMQPQQAMQQGRQQGGMPQMGAQSQLSMGFTGYGQDGALQPQNPTGMATGPNGETAMVHEGEIQIRMPDGTNAVIPANEVPQEFLQNIQKRTGMKGYALGTRLDEARTAISSTVDAMRPTYGTKTADAVSAPQTTTNLQSFQMPGTETKTADNVSAKDPVPSFQMPGATMKAADTITAQTPTVDLPNIDPMKVHKQPDATPTPTTAQTPSLDRFNQSMNQLGQFAQGYSPHGDKIRMEEQERMKAEEQAAKGSLSQTMAQQGIQGREALTEQAMQGREIGQQQATIEGQIRKQEQAQAFSAAQQLPGLALQGDAAEFARQKYGDEEGQRIADDINAGMTMEQIQQKYPNANIDDTSYNSMKSASEWGKMEFDRKVDTANALINQGGVENYAKAAEIFSGLYGTDIDFSNALTAENSAKFNAGRNNMLELVASGVDWEDALEVMKKDGSLEAMGLLEDDVKRIFEKQKLESNPIYQVTKIAEDWAAAEAAAGRPVDPDKLDNIIAYMTDAITNPGGVKFETGIQIKDEFGNEVGFFTDSAEAAKFLADNADKKYTSEKIKDHVKHVDPADLGNKPNLPEEITNLKDGEYAYTTKDGKVYKTDNEGNESVVEYDPTDPFGTESKEILKQAYNPEKPYNEQPEIVKEVLTGQLKKYLDGSETLPTNIKKTDPIYKAMLSRRDVPEFNSKRKYEGKDARTDRYVFPGMPDVGGYFKAGDNVYKLVSKKTVGGGGSVGEKEYVLESVVGGDRITIKAVKDSTQNANTLNYLKNYGMPNVNLTEINATKGIENLNEPEAEGAPNVKVSEGDVTPVNLSGRG
jgi:hypothetical protein